MELLDWIQLHVVLVVLEDSGLDAIMNKLIK